MKKLFLFILLAFMPTLTQADNVILMVGDGMGFNHLKCAAQEKPLYLTALPVKGTIHTSSANQKITDSAAAATAYACGQKTNNSFLGKLPNGENCLTIAEEAVQKEYAVGIYSTDHATGATPSAFYAHTTDRNDQKTIEADKAKAAQHMDIVVPADLISDEVDAKLTQLYQQPDKKGFFVLFEGAKIDTNSHKNLFEDMKTELYDFDYAVMKATHFIVKHPDTTLIVLADHETGGLTEACAYTTHKHTGQDVPVYAYGQHADLFKGEQENTAVYAKIKQILFR